MNTCPPRGQGLALRVPGRDQLFWRLPRPGQRAAQTLPFLGLWGNPPRGQMRVGCRRARTCLSSPHSLGSQLRAAVWVSNQVLNKEELNQLPRSL